jgi:ATP dependent DNA ligase domain.
LLGELFFPNRPGSKEVQTVMGCLKEKALARQAAGDKINFYVFDCLAYNGQITYKEGYGTRIKYVKNLNNLGSFPCVQYAKYYRGHELWIHLQMILASGGEGVVIMDEKGIYEPGKRPSKTTLKVKKELEQTIDCFFTGKASAPTHEYTGKELETWIYWEDSRTGELRQGELFKDYAAGATIIPVTKGYFNHWAGSLEIAVLKKKEGAIATCGAQTIKNYEIYTIGWLSNLSDEVKAEPKKFAWKPIEVTAMELDQISGALRHGKLKTWRDDLEIKDCCWEKIWG